MATFDYSRFHYFDKNGSELMLRKTSPVTFQLINSKDPTSQSEYIYVKSAPDTSAGSFERIRTGYRYPLTLNGSGVQTNSLTALYNGEEITIQSTYFDKPESYKTSKGTEYTPVITTDQTEVNSLLSKFDSSIAFPTMTFDSKITFERVSTELVETQSIYVLVENPAQLTKAGTDKYTTVKQYATDASVPDASDASAYINRYKLFFFIDNRTQTDFRLFKTNGSDVIWTDRILLDLDNGSTDYVFDNGYRVDVGFCGKEEGVYEEDMYVCILDTQDDDKVYPVGTIHMTAETVGEDERYRTLFTNFGIPDPKEYDNIFKETPNIEDGVDYISINKHSKQMFLSYPEIFPYVGTYKALVNAIKTLGYDDIFFKEWYKELGDITFEDGGYIAYDLQYGNDPKANTITNVPIEERIHLKKLNWLTMFYKINEVLDKPVNRWGFPEVVRKSNYYSANNLLKIISLKRWLEKYITGVNCRITGVTGEGIVFERYSLPKYGQYQRVLDYQIHKPIYPIVKNEAVALVDSNAEIEVEISVSQRNITIEDTYPNRFLDYCEGYFDSSVFRDVIDTLGDSSTYTYYGKTFDLNEIRGNVDLNTKCESKRYLLHTNNQYINAASQSRGLLVDNNRFVLDPHNTLGVLNSKMFSIFENLPVIQIKKGYIKKYNKKFECDGSIGYMAEILPHEGKIVAKVRESGDSPTHIVNFSNEPYAVLTPPTHTEDTLIHIIPISKKLGDTHISDISKNPYNDYTDSAYTTASAKTYINFGERTYGLEYTIDNVNGIPCFKMTGYENLDVWDASNLQHFPSIQNDSSLNGFDYYLEILDGRMIFDPNPDGEILILNFSYEGNKSIIDVELYKDTNFTLQHRYRNSTSDFVSSFLPGQSYGNFITYYREDAEQAVFFDNLASINVHNEGVYTIGMKMMDENGNVFAAKSDKKVNVLTQEIDAYVLGASEGTTITVSGDDKKDSSFCIFEYAPHLHVNDVCIGDLTLSLDGVAKYDFDSETFENTGTLLLNGYDDEYEYLNISNSVEKFVVSGYAKVSDTSIYNFVKKSVNGNSIYCTDASSSNNAAHRSQASDTQITSNNGYDIMNILVSNMSRNIEGTDADVYVTIFDLVCGKPVYITPAIAISTYNDSSVNAKNEYLLAFRNSGDGETCKGYFGKSRYEIYLIPAWAIKSTMWVGNNRNIAFMAVNTKQYPFTKFLTKGDLCKVSYSDTAKKYFGQMTTKIKSNQNTQQLSKQQINVDTDYFNLIQDAPVWVSPTSLEYTSHKMKGSTFDTNTFKLKLKNTYENRNKIKLIDKTYTVERRNFDIDKAIECWMTDASIGQITTMRSSGEPFETNTGKVVLKLNPGFNTSNIQITKWSIYRRTDESNGKLYIECFNNAVFVNLEEGIYDIKVTAYDKYGNRYTKQMDGWITVK